MISKHDIDNIDAIISGYGDWFSAQLIRLIGKADDSNRERIRAGFPAEVALWEMWYYKRPSYDEAFLVALRNPVTTVMES
jgi:hypothetical protein